MARIGRGGPFAGLKVDDGIPGYEVSAETPIGFTDWVGGVRLHLLEGGPLAGLSLPIIPLGYEPHEAELDTAVWTGKELLYETPYRLTDVWPAVSRTYCSACGIESIDRDAQKLRLIVHRRRGTRGHTRVYCPSHLPQSEWMATDVGDRPPCPECGLLLPSTGRCDYC